MKIKLISGIDNSFNHFTLTGTLVFQLNFNLTFKTYSKHNFGYPKLKKKLGMEMCKIEAYLLKVKCIYIYIYIYIYIWLFKNVTW